LRREEVIAIGGVMSYELDIIKEKSYLHICATGVRSLKNVVAIAKEVLEACAEINIDRVLVDVTSLVGQLRTIDGYNIAVQEFAQLRRLSVLRKAAIVDLNENKDRLSFLETVAINRGYAFRGFLDIEEALEWLFA
jgi:hypothetical protein